MHYSSGMWQAAELSMVTQAVQDILPLENSLEAVSIELESGLQSGTLFCLIMTMSLLCIYSPQTPL